MRGTVSATATASTSFLRNANKIFKYMSWYYNLNIWFYVDLPSQINPLFWIIRCKGEFRRYLEFRIFNKL